MGEYKCPHCKKNITYMELYEYFCDTSESERSAFQITCSHCEEDIVVFSYETLNFELKTPEEASQ